MTSLHCCWRACSGWSTGGTTPRASSSPARPRRASPARSRWSRPRAGSASWRPRSPSASAGTTGIAHTRWATHGAPSDENAHPHLDAENKVAVVHNGIIDNASELRAKLTADGIVFLSETDTEVLVHLIARAQADTLEEKVREALRHVEGTYGIAVLHADFNDRIVVARNGSPVVLGIGEKEMFVASDVAALVAHTRQVVTLDDGEMATLKADDFRTYTTEGSTTTATPTTVEWEAESYDMGGHDTYMHKEISEQADAVDRVLRGRIDDRFSTVHLGGLNLDAREARGVRRIKILGCGTSYHAGQIGAQLIEELARIPADAEPTLRVPLPQPGRGPRHPVRRGLPVGRDLRRAGGRPGAEAQGRPRPRRGQRGRLRHRP